MGLTWDKSRRVMDNSKIVTNAIIPVAGEKYWDLWRASKEEIKTDGFSIKKNYNAWNVSYWVTINDNTYEKTITGKYLWEVEFDAKCRKYAARMGGAKIVGISAEKEENLFEATVVEKNIGDEYDLLAASDDE